MKKWITKKEYSIMEGITMAGVNQRILRGTIPEEDIKKVKGKILINAEFDDFEIEEE